MIQTTTTVSFSDSSSASSIERKLKLENIGLFRLGATQTIDVYRLFPPVSANLDATTGAISLAPEIEEESIVENIKFSNSNKASLSYPRQWYNASRWTTPDPEGPVFSSPGVSMRKLYAYDEEGGRVSPSLSYDAASNSVISDLPFSGLVNVSYKAKYRLVRLSRGSHQILASGTITAHHRGAIAESSFSAVTPHQPIIVYSVVSEYLADATGPWEVPPGWPDDVAYPDRPGSETPDETSHQQLERVHENAFLDIDGTMRWEKYVIRWERPYVGSNEYHPVYKFDPGTPPSEGDRLERAWKQINWSAIYSDVTSRYPGIQGAGT